MPEPALSRDDLATRYLDQLLTEQLVLMAKGDGHTRYTPALVFCFNRDECWSVAEQLKGLQLLGDDQRTRLHGEVNRLDWSQGVGPKIRQMLHRGVGVHHAGMLPKYRRAVGLTRRLPVTSPTSSAENPHRSAATCISANFCSVSAINGVV